MKKFLKFFSVILLALAFSFPAQAEIQNTTFTTSFACNGLGINFPFTFPIYGDYNATVTVTTGSTVATLVPVTNYTMVPSTTWPYTYTNGGTVTLLNPASCPSGSTLTITRSTPLTQLSLYRNGQALNQNVLMSDLDKIWMALQETWAAAQAGGLQGPTGPQGVPGIVNTFNTSVATVAVFLKETLTGDLSLTYSDGIKYLLFLDSNGAVRNVNFTGFPAGFEVFCYNYGAYEIVLDSAGIAKIVPPLRGRSIYFDGTNWINPNWGEN